ncbi:MAG: hypothetical protein AAF530_13895 [Pseudomonadota bacterium]
MPANDQLELPDGRSPAEFVLYIMRELPPTDRIAGYDSQYEEMERLVEQRGLLQGFYRTGQIGEEERRIRTENHDLAIDLKFAAARKEVITRLRSGKLIAKGFCRVGMPMMAIPNDFWAFMELNFEHDSANYKGRFHFRGIQIFRKNQLTENQQLLASKHITFFHRVIVEEEEEKAKKMAEAQTSISAKTTEVNLVQTHPDALFDPFQGSVSLARAAEIYDSDRWDELKKLVMEMNYPSSQVDRKSLEKKKSEIESLLATTIIEKLQKRTIALQKVADSGSMISATAEISASEIEKLNPGSFDFTNSSVLLKSGEGCKVLVARPNRIPVRSALEQAPIKDAVEKSSEEAEKKYKQEVADALALVPEGMRDLSVRGSIVRLVNYLHDNHLHHIKKETIRRNISRFKSHGGHEKLFDPSNEQQK